ncbi:hypothetical protein KKG71_01905 [Patescibacteria group bacterium]|nr:hypothetical protein [Patescibacteria group bacterium]
MELTKLLEKIGLKKKESQIYLNLLEYGPSPASLIASKVNLKRTTIYHIIEDLIKRGFVKKTIHHNITYFNPVNPEQIDNLIDTKINYLNNIKKDLKTHLAVLQTLQNKPIEKPKITYFEGVEGAQKAYDDILTAESTVLEINLPDDVHKSLSEEWVENFVKKRIEKKVFLKAIIPDTPVCLEYVNKDSGEYRQTIALPKELKLPMHSSISIYDNKINIINLKKSIIGIIIENKYLAETMKSLYKLAWETAVQKAIKHKTAGKLTIEDAQKNMDNKPTKKSTKKKNSTK